VKKIYIFGLICIIVQTSVAAQLSNFVQQFKATGFVNDYAKLMQDVERTQLENKIVAINDTTSIQFAVITLQSLEEYTAKDVAEGIASYWGVGQKKLNNGILILASVRQRAIHIALGEGTDDYISDDYIKTLIKQVVKPAFQKGAYAKGINEAIEKIYMQLSGTDLDSRVVKQQQKFYWMATGILSLLIVCTVSFWVVKKSRD